MIGREQKSVDSLTIREIREVCQDEDVGTLDEAIEVLKQEFECEIDKKTLESQLRLILTQLLGDIVGYIKSPFEYLKSEENTLVETTFALIKDKTLGSAFDEATQKIVAEKQEKEKNTDALLLEDVREAFKKATSLRDAINILEERSGKISGNMLASRLVLICTHLLGSRDDYPPFKCLRETDDETFLTKVLANQKDRTVGSAAAEAEEKKAAAEAEGKKAAAEAEGKKAAASKQEKELLSGNFFQKATDDARQATDDDDVNYDETSANPSKKRKFC